jgi:uncharacterized protein (UPF0335 family)
MKLYEATADMATVNDWIAEHEEEIIAAGGELPPELQELLDLAEGQLAEKVERVAFYIRRLEGEEQIIKDEISRLQNRAKVKANSVKGLKEYLQRCLEGAGETKIERPLITVAIQKSPPSVHCGADLENPESRRALGAYVREKITWSLDAKKVLEIHKAGGELPSSITVVTNTHLRIR